MADQNVAEATAEAAEKVTDKAAEAAPAADAAPKAEAKTETTPTAPEAKQDAKPASAKPAKTAKPARKPAAATKKQAQPAKKPAAARKQRKPAGAGANMTKGAKTMAKQNNSNIDSGLFAADQFKNVFGDVNERAKAATERSAKIVEELADLTRGNVEAFVASSKIAAKGVESMSQDAAEYGRKSFEEASTALKTFAEVKSATDFFKLQGDYARAAFDSAVSESARFSENMLKIAGDAAQPITSRYTVAAERAKTLAA